LYTFNQTNLSGKLTCTLLLLVFSGSAMAFGSKGRVEPLFSRYAQTYKSPTLDLKVEAFHNKPMEEMRNFNGSTTTLDFTYPINDVSQIELLFPMYTGAKGDLRKDADPVLNTGAVKGDRLKVRGYGGVRDFTSLIYERQMPSLEKKFDVNMAWRLGYGRRMDTLDARYKGKLVDKYNHSGYNVQGGLKLDTDVQNGEITLFSNLHYIQYLDSDDINYQPPTKKKSRVTFGVIKLNTAIMFNTFGKTTPVMEALLVQDTMGYTSFSLSPEIIYTVSNGMDLKLGVPFKLTKQGQDYAGVFEGTYRF